MDKQEAFPAALAGQCLLQRTGCKTGRVCEDNTEVYKCTHTRTYFVVGTKCMK